MTSIAYITEIGEDKSSPAGAAGAAGSSKGDTGTSQQVQTTLPPAPTQPSSTAPRINAITHNPIVPLVNKVGNSLEERRKNLSSAEYRIKKLDSIIPKIHTSLSQQHHPTGAVVSGFVNQSLSTITCIEHIFQKVEDSNDTISMNLNLIEHSEDSSDFHPKDYSEDINYIRKTTDYKMEALNNKF